MGCLNIDIDQTRFGVIEAYNTYYTLFSHSYCMEMYMTKIIKLFFLLSLLLVLSACKIDDELNSIKEFQDSEKVWVYIQFNIEESGNKIDDYYYFGEINASLYSKMKTRKIQSGFIAMSNIKYWASDDSIQSIGDEIYSNEMLFRIEDIRKVSLLSNEPKDGFKYTEEEIKDEISMAEEEKE